MWDREEYIIEAEKQLGDEEVYEEVSNDAAPLLKTINEVIAKTRKLGVLKRDTLDYFIKESKFARFYLLPKIHKRLHNVPGRPVISTSGYYTKNISSFPDHCLQSLGHVVKYYIKGTNKFLKELRSLPKLPDGIILCSMDVEGYLVTRHLSKNGGLLLVPSQSKACRFVKHFIYGRTGRSFNKRILI